MYTLMKSRMPKIGWVPRREGSAFADDCEKDEAESLPTVPGSSTAQDGWLRSSRKIGGYRTYISPHLPKHKWLVRGFPKIQMHIQLN